MTAGTAHCLATRQEQQPSEVRAAAPLAKRREAVTAATRSTYAWITMVLPGLSGDGMIGGEREGDRAIESGASFSGPRRFGRN